MGANVIHSLAFAEQTVAKNKAKRILVELYTESSPTSKSCTKSITENKAEILKCMRLKARRRI